MKYKKGTKVYFPKSGKYVDTSKVYQGEIVAVKSGVFSNSYVVEFEDLVNEEDRSYDKHGNTIFSYKKKLFKSHYIVPEHEIYT